MYSGSSLHGAHAESHVDRRARCSHQFGGGLGPGAAKAGTGGQLCMRCNWVLMQASIDCRTRASSGLLFGKTRHLLGTLLAAAGGWVGQHLSQDNPLPLSQDNPQRPHAAKD